MLKIFMSDCALIFAANELSWCASFPKISYNEAVDIILKSNGVTKDTICNGGKRKTDEDFYYACRVYLQSLQGGSSIVYKADKSFPADQTTNTGWIVSMFKDCR